MEDPNNSNASTNDDERDLILNEDSEVKNLPACATGRSGKFFIFAKISTTISGGNFLF
jgi:hypothetical protein